MEITPEQQLIALGDAPELSRRLRVLGRPERPLDQLRDSSAGTSTLSATVFQPDGGAERGTIRGQDRPAARLGFQQRLERRECAPRILGPVVAGAPLEFIRRRDEAEVRCYK